MNARERDETTRYSRSRAAFARRSRAATPRALAIALRAPTRDSRDRAHASRARRAKPSFSSRGRPIVSRQTRDLAFSADRFAAMYCIREISRIQHAIGTMIQNADARSRARTTARVADGGFPRRRDRD